MWQVLKSGKITKVSDPLITISFEPRAKSYEFSDFS